MPQTRMSVRGRPSSVAPELLFAAGGVAQYAGAALAVLVFRWVPAGGVAWLRIASAAAVLALWRRPWRSVRTRRQLAAVAPLGLALGAMNVAFYLSIDRLPLGSAVAIELLGPLTVATLGSRTARDGLALCLALAGVGLLAGVHVGGSPLGVALALCAAAMWSLYIVLGHRLVARREVPPQDGLAAAMLVAALAFAAPLAPPAHAALHQAWLLPACVGVGLASSVVPYLLDQLAMARISRARFALLNSLLPAIATLAGVVVLAQLPSLAEAAGIALVIGASALRSHA